MKVHTKGVGPGLTLAWPGRRQPDIPVEVDTDRLQTSRFKKCYANYVLLYFPSTEFKSAFNVYWHGGGAAGLSCTELSIWEFPFLGGPVGRGGMYMILCEGDAPEGHPGWCCVHLCARILSSSLTSVSIFSVCWYSIVSISMVHTSRLNRQAGKSTF